MHYFVLVGHIQSMLPIVVSVIFSEVFVDCVKHAFITKFNDISPDIYRRYRLILSNDMTISRSTRVGVLLQYSIHSFMQLSVPEL